MHDFFCFYCEKHREREFLETRERGWGCSTISYKDFCKMLSGPYFLVLASSFVTSSFFFLIVVS